MEWFIGIFVVYLIWKFFLNPMSDVAMKNLIKKEISNAYYISGEVYCTDLFYSHCQNFANKRSAFDNGNSISFEMLIDKEKHKITFFEHERVGFAKNSYTDILVEKI